MHIKIADIRVKADNIEDIQVLVKSFSDGYESGKTWPKEWNNAPGGPAMFCSFKSGKYSRENHRLWHAGFKKGVKTNPNLTDTHPARRT